MGKLDLEVILNVLIWKGKNIMKKKILITMLTVSLLMPVMTGCGADNRNSDEVQKETVKDVSEMVHMENAAAVKELMDAAYAKVTQDMLPAALHGGQDARHLAVAPGLGRPVLSRHARPVPLAHALPFPRSVQ